MLAQAYRWTLDDIKKLSYMQVLLIQHAASHNRKVLDKRLEENRSKSPSEELAEMQSFAGKAVTQMTSEELIMLAGSEGGRAPKVIKLKKDPPNEQPEPEG